MKNSGLPTEKTLAALQQEKLPVKARRQLPALCDGGFVERAENVLVFGLPGRGKTHLVCAVGHELVRRGYSVLFVTAAMLVQRLLLAKKELSLRRGSVCAPDRAPRRSALGSVLFGQRLYFPGHRPSRHTSPGAHGASFGNFATHRGGVVAYEHASAGPHPRREQSAPRAVGARQVVAPPSVLPHTLSLAHDRKTPLLPSLQGSPR